MTRCIPHVPVLNPLQMVALAGALSLLGSLPSPAGDLFTGQPDGRVDDGAVFHAQNPSNSAINYNFRVDSSLDATKWWVSTSPALWENVVTPATTPDAGGFVGMRVDEPVDAGTGFWFGLSFENEMENLKHALRIRYGAGADGPSKPPNDTQIYIGYSRFGTAAGVNWDDHGIDFTDNPSTQRPINVKDISDNTPPASAFPTSLVNYYSWISAIQDDTVGGGGAGDDSDTTRLIVVPDQANTMTEMVVVIVYPSTQGYAPDTDNPDNNIHFSWTFDGQPILSSTNPSFDGGDILIPEPSRTMLLGLAFALLILRRSRPH